MAFEKKTLFVAGAGASYEVGLPMGEGLKDLISEKVNIRYEDGYRLAGGDNTVVAALEAFGHQNGVRDLNPYYAAGRQVAAGMPLALSIDNFLHMHAHDELVVKMGKIGIAASIMEAEARSTIMPPDRGHQLLVFKKENQSWHVKLVQMLLEGIQIGNIENIFDNISVISFNYDRCIEHYLSHALANQLNMQLPEAQKLVAGLEVIHPYGQVGKLPLLIGEEGSPFGTRPDRWNLWNIAMGIRTFTERIDDEDMLTRMRDLLADAERIVFVGFAFWPINMDLLTIRDAGADKEIFATTFGLAEPERNAAFLAITRAFSAFGQNELNIRLIDAKAKDMLRDYYPAIAN